jgi:hypothetical protein
MRFTNFCDSKFKTTKPAIAQWSIKVHNGHVLKHTIEPLGPWRRYSEI